MGGGQPKKVSQEDHSFCAVDHNLQLDHPVLKVEQLSMHFGGLVAVDRLSFDVQKNHITSIIGPNGAGKTTVFNCLTGFYKPSQGRLIVHHGDQDILKNLNHLTYSSKRSYVKDDGALYLLERMPDFEVAAKARLARTFQNIRLFGGMSVLENLMIAQHNVLMRASAYSFGGLLNLPFYQKARRDALEKAAYWLDVVGLYERADDAAGDLPYGDQRRLEIARALCAEPVLLCLDEPAAGLNPSESKALNVLLKLIRDDHKISILLIEHDMSVVMDISDHVIVLDYGRKISDGTADYVRHDPKVIAAYLGVDEKEAGQFQQREGTHE